MTSGRLISVFTLAFGVTMAGCIRPAKTINVPEDYSTIQAAVDAAVNGDVIVVAPGRYKSNIWVTGHNLDFKGRAITVRSTDPTDPAVLSATIIDGDGRGSVVTFKSGEKTDSVLDGFTITNGSGTLTHDGSLCGGGVYCCSSSPTLIRNVISGNAVSTGYSSTGVPASSAYGGGLYRGANASPAVSDNIITGNAVNGNPSEEGGVYCTESSPSLTGNVITANSARNGGGVFCHRCSPALTGNTIDDNTVGWSGGGVCCEEAASPTLINNNISGNKAHAHGGDISSGLGSSPLLTDDTVTGNSVTGENGYGGGVDCWGSSPVIRNTIVAFNAGGGGLYVSAFPRHPSKPTVAYCDFHGNTGGNYVGWPDQTGTGGNISANLCSQMPPTATSTSGPVAADGIPQPEPGSSIPSPAPASTPATRPPPSTASRHPTRAGSTWGHTGIPLRPPSLPRRVDPARGDLEALSKRASDAQRSQLR